MNEEERRAYQRSNHFYTVAKISSDEKVWKEVEIVDLSSGGLQMYTPDIYQTGDILWFHLKVQGFFSEFEIKAQGKVRRLQLNDNSNLYGIAFIGLRHDLEILLDENVRNDRPFGRNPYNYG